MSSISVLVADFWSDYAFFRRGYSTTSPLTYPFPPRTAISGLIACIVGMDWNEYYSKVEDKFSQENSLFSIQLLNPIKKIRINQNLIDTKQGFYLWDIVLKKQEPRTQIPFEYIKDPKYRIFVWFKNKDLFNLLHEMLEAHKSVYTPYFGVSELIANFRYVGIYNAEKKNAGHKTPIMSVVKKEHKIDFEEGKVYERVKVPAFMKKDRTLTGSLELIYEKNGNPINITSGEYYQVNGYGNIVLF
ncbi:MAG: type I-B CRISPR-associated protein Cas5b [Thermoproteota archaeon]